MSARPAPRKSSLNGLSPIAPPTQQQIDDANAAAEAEHAEFVQQLDAAESPATPAAPVSPKPAQEGGIKKKYRHKVSFYQDPEDTSRVRGTILHTQVAEGTRGLSQFIAEAVMEKVERLEATYNNGEPFPAIGARELPQGRPMGE